MLRALSFVLSVGLTIPAFGQTSAVGASSKPTPALKSHPEWPKGELADTRTIQSTVAAFYSAISAPAGGKLDRDRLRSLFVPGGRIAIGLPPASTRSADVILVSPDQYADASDAATAKQGFFDRVIADQIEHFGVMAHVYSAYESRNSKTDPKPFVRGVKSIELLDSAGRWYLVEVYWDRERSDNPIPEAYLHDRSL